MKFFDAARPLYLETNASGIGHGARLLQVRDGMNCRHDKKQIMQYCDLLHLQARAYQVHSGTTAT